MIRNIPIKYNANLLEKSSNHSKENMIVYILHMIKTMKEIEDMLF